MLHAGCFTKTSFTRAVATRSQLFSVTNRLLGVARITQYPPFKDIVVLAYRFGDFFAPKIVVIQNMLDNMATKVSPGSGSKSRKLIEAAIKKSYSIDQILTPLVVGCIDILLPVITKIINLSLYRRVHLLISGSVL